MSISLVRFGVGAVWIVGSPGVSLRLSGGLLAASLRESILPGPKDGRAPCPLAELNSVRYCHVGAIRPCQCTSGARRLLSWGGISWRWHDLQHHTSTQLALISTTTVQKAGHPPSQGPVHRTPRASSFLSCSSDARTGLRRRPAGLLAAKSAASPGRARELCE